MRLLSRLTGAERRYAGLELFELKNLGLGRRPQNQSIIRELCNPAYVGDGTVLARVLGRFKMFLDANDAGLSPHLMLDGYWEMWLTEAIASTVKPGMIAVDIGANLGYFTLLMAELVGPGGKVHAFEPNPAIADRLAKSIDINGFRDRVTLHRNPLGSQDGAEVILCVPTGEPKNAYLTWDANAPGAIKLSSRRYDSHAELLEADVIKIDAEAAELDIWHGMSGLLEAQRRPLTIFLEFASARYADPGGFLDEIVGAGFELGEVDLRSGIRRKTHEEILAAPAHIDQMLMLRRA